MAFCTQCGHQLADGSKFCNKCGSPVEKKQCSDEISLDVEISIRVVLKGESNGNTEVEVYLPHLSKTVAVKVPNNIAIGQSLRLRGLGHTSPDGKKGDAYIRIVQIDYDNTPLENQEPRRKVRYEGEVRQCPQCKEIINAFVPVCPSCGFELRGSSATSIVHELAMNLQNTQSVSEKEKLIRNFYIPNTREDIIECLILASSNIETNSDCRDAWAAKLEQIYQKAKLTFGSSADFEYVEMLYHKTIRTLHKKQSISHVKEASGGVTRGAAWTISALWNAICKILKFVWSIICGLGKSLKSGYAWALLFLGISFISQFACALVGTGKLYIVFSDLTDGARAIALIIAGVTLYGRAWRALDKK